MNGCTPRSSARETQELIADLESRFQQQTLAMATALVSLLDLRNRYTGAHSLRLANYVRGIGIQMRVSDDEIKTIMLAASLHDIGEVGIPDDILLKPGKLTDHEFEWIRQHPAWAWMAMRNVDCLQDAALLILHHHERFDGTGYPSRLRGAEIPLGSRIIAVADCFDALTSRRPYRTAYTCNDALTELLSCSDKQLDAKVVNAFRIYFERRTLLERRRGCRKILAS
jgi:HD-GYP domain-containing protein (c-di-GMP phosphodiesterase class II)